MNQFQTVAAELQRLGGAPLSKVVEELAKRQGAALTGVDLLTAYDPEKLLPGGRGIWWWIVRTLEIVRDGLVFVPVAFTWWQVAGALSAYGKTNGQTPFLLAWQAGFPEGKVPTVTPLSSSATFIALLVGMVVVLTVVVRTADEWLESRHRRRLAELSAALTRATFLIAGKPLSTGQTVSLAALQAVGTQVNSSSVELTNALKEATDSIARAVSAGPGSELHTIFTSWLAAADRLGELGSSLKNSQETTDELSRLQRILSTEVQAFTKEATEFMTELKGERNLSRDQAHVQGRVADGVARSTVMLGEALHALNDRTHLFHEIVSRISQAVTRLESEGGGNGYAQSANSAPPRGGR